MDLQYEINYAKYNILVLLFTTFLQIFFRITSFYYERKFISLYISFSKVFAQKNYNGFIFYYVISYA